MFSDNADQLGRPTPASASDCPSADHVLIAEHLKPPETYSPSCPDSERLRSDLESGQEDTTQFVAMRKALEAGEIHEDQNPCTYPADLREDIGLTDSQCAGELGRMLARQYD
jgi:hypothetical protein